MRIDDLEVQIVVDGKVAEEYADIDFDQEPVDGEASKYIEIVLGQSFALKCTAHEEYKFTLATAFLTFKVIIDGYGGINHELSKAKVD